MILSDSVDENEKWIVKAARRVAMVLSDGVDENEKWIVKAATDSGFGRSVKSGG